MYPHHLCETVRASVIVLFLHNRLVAQQDIQYRPWLPSLVKPDAADQVRETRVAAQGIKEGMYLEEFENV